METDGQPDPKKLYAKTQIEHYLSVEQFSWVRPGLVVEVESIEIPADRYPVAVVSFTDDLGQPLDREGVVTPGPVTFSFVLSWYDASLRDYVAYTTRPQTSPITGETAIQASSDSGGTIQDLEIGRLRYTFGTQLPDGYDMSVTHSLGIYATRDLREIDIVGKRYYDNVVEDFRPDGEDLTDVWASIDDATCNSCHEQLALHGGSRRDVKLCVLCHNKQTWDPDTFNTVDIKVMIHKIHAGAQLPSVQAGIPYQIIGYMQSVHDYSEVLFPQDNRNCARCHTPSAPESDIWYSRPNRDACGSCHDDIDWETGENHAGGPASSDQFCSACHPPEGQREFDASVIGAHTIPTESTQLAGLNAEILGVTNTAPGMNPTVTYRVTDDSGAFVDPATLDSMRILVGGPTTEYTEYFREDARGATVANEVATYTMTTPVPENATGSWAFSADVYRFVVIDDGSADGLQVREAAFNPLYYAAVTDDEPAPRREVVNLDKCNVCHDALALHGGQRFRIEECVICHNPNVTDDAVRPSEEMPPESVHFKWLIHRIHTGKHLTNDFTVYGFMGSVHNYNHVGYPGDLRTCVACHESDTYSVPITDDALPTLTERDFYSPYQPEAAACNSCHSTEHAAAHAWVNTAPFGEACASCHGDNRTFSVDAVHAH